MDNLVNKGKFHLKPLAVFISALIFLTFINACKLEKEKNLNQEMNQRKNQVPQLNTQVPDQPQITPLTNITQAQEKIKELAISVIKKNMAATEAEDIKGVLATLHEDNPQLKSTKNGMNFVFKNYNLRFTLLETEAISIAKDEVQIYYKQRTEGHNFESRETSGIHVLRKSKDGKWKIYKTEYL